MTQRSTTIRSSRRGGFTLVELLVSVVLVLLIMLMMASVFEMASGTVTKQKGTAENDQQARNFTTIIKGDLCNRSYRNMIPYRNGEIGDPLREGYFSISENGPNNDGDDVLSLTVFYGGTLNSCLYTDTSAVGGRTVLLKDPTVMMSDNAYLQANPNQPEFDDGYPVVNKLGQSPAAEVVYFKRGDKLYRRVLLLRQVYDDTGSSPPNYQPSQIVGPYPQGSGMTAAFYVDSDSANGPDGTWTFWRDFDYAAVFDSANSQPYFLLTNGLDNSFAGTVDTYPATLGVPHQRFGHAHTDSQGRPREWLEGADGEPGVAGADDDGNGITDRDGMGNLDMGEYGAVGSDDVFFGRFLHQETSHSTFGYPGRIPAPQGDPHLRDDLTLDPDTNLITQFGDQTYRRGEDVLMTNVLSFDVKVWDDVLKQYVDLGHSLSNSAGVQGHFHAARNRNRSHGNIYDTWHPHPAITAVAPFCPATPGLDGLPGLATVDDDGDGTTDNARELGYGDDIPLPLKSIQITVRFVDPTNKLVRQVTISESLIDP